MLAEPVKNTSYVLQPRGKPLYEDESQANSFGMKMLTKMGWNKDKGLGAKEDGAKDFIRVRYKNSSTGMGFQEKDTQWTEHEDHFSQLLNNLQAGEDEDTNRNCESLEEKSRKSRARVHYKKFTKGKDLSQYSEKDLANIFGRKSLKREISKDEDAQEDSRPSTASNFGVETMTSELSISDYFKKKMSQMEDTAVENVSGESSKKKKKRKQQNRSEEDELPKDPSEDSATKEPKKKRKRKSKPTVEESEKKNKEMLQVVKSPTENEKESSKEEFENLTKDPESKKSKRKNKKIPQQDPDTSQNPSEESTSDRKVKKKNKQKSESTELVTVVEESPADPQLPSTKKSKKKEKQLSAEDDTIPPKLRESLKEYSANGDVVYKLPMRKCDILMKLDCAAFKGSNISSVIGYRLTDKIDLEVIEDFQTAKNEDGAKEEDPYDERL